MIDKKEEAITASMLTLTKQEKFNFLASIIETDFFGSGVLAREAMMKHLVIAREQEDQELIDLIVPFLVVEDL